MKTREYIDLCRQLTETGSDYAVARLLGITEQAVNAYRKGGRVMDNNTALAIAHALKLPLEEIIASAAIEREKDPEIRKKWEIHLKRLAQHAAVVCAIILTAGYTGIGAKETLASTHVSGSSGDSGDRVIQIMRHFRRTVGRWVARLRRSTAIAGVMATYPTPSCTAPSGA